MITCTRRLHFSTAHRVYGHESKCGHIHGHNYVVLIEARAKGLDSVGRIIDFSVLKERFDGWIQQQWDHGTILSYKDPIAELWSLNGPLKAHKLWVAPFNPTAEELAQYLLDIGNSLLMKDTGIEISKVTVWETENCFAEATL